jgi:hypothetical protein
VESNWVHSALQPLIGLLSQPQVIMMIRILVEWLAGETEVLGANLPPMPLCPSQTPHAARTRTRAAAVGSQRLAAWATARPRLRVDSGRYFWNTVYSRTPMSSCEAAIWLGISRSASPFEINLLQRTLDDVDSQSRNLTRLGDLQLQADTHMEAFRSCAGRGNRLHFLAYLENSE